MRGATSYCDEGNEGFDGIELDLSVFKNEFIEAALEDLKCNQEVELGLSGIFSIPDKVVYFSSK